MNDRLEHNPYQPPSEIDSTPRAGNRRHVGVRGQCPVCEKELRTTGLTWGRLAPCEGCQTMLGLAVPVGGRLRFWVGIAVGLALPVFCLEGLLVNNIIKLLFLPLIVVFPIGFALLLRSMIMVPYPEGLAKRGVATAFTDQLVEDMRTRHHHRASVDARDA